MKIIFLRSNPVDPDPRVEKQVNALIGRGHEVSIFCWDREKNYKLNKQMLNLENGMVPIYRVGIQSIYSAGFRGNIKPLFKFQIHLLKWLLTNRSKYEVIHACDFDTAFVSNIVSKILSKKIIYDIFDYYVDSYSVPQKLKRVIEYADLQTINAANAVILCTEERISQIKNAQPKMVEFIHNSPQKYFVKNNKIPNENNKIKIAYVGILSNGRLLKELIRIVENSEVLELHLGGFGILEEYISEKASANINIIFYGKVSYAESLKIASSCDIMTAIYDPKIRNHHFAAPNKFYEALMLGKPLIMVKNTGMSHVIDNYKIGTLIEYSQVSLEKGIERLISTKENWNKVSYRMKDIYTKEYGWDVMEERLIKLYSKI